MPPPSVKSIFLDALALPAADRPGYLAAACPDPAARAEVDALLAAHARGGGWLGPGGPAPTTGGSPTGPADDAPAAPDPLPGPAAGAVVGGRYKLLEPVGEGGMGAVWMAQQTEPVRRLVAVKLVKAGMDSRAVLARFEAERQALAMMDHPNIAKVLDAGAGPDGRPFFVMELVKGVPITQFCDARRLGVRDRLALFADVCRAVQHAHQKGIIHRDLKPSNVLVARYDDHPVPKVIDFGVAKAAGQPLTEATLHTGFGAVVGTPAYMAPEQAALNNLDVDTRADVYGLGALLYELLTGSPPFARADLQKAGLLEMLRVVREVDPPRPSTRLSTADGRPSIAAVRGTDPGALARLLRSDLDWVVMKALEKDRARRYETAAGFAADVQRYLAGEPVQAAPPSGWYRARKFARRHRAGVAVGLLLVLALAAGVGGLLWAAGERARREADRATAADKAAERDRQAREQAQALTAKLQRLLGAADPEIGGPEMTVRELLDKEVPNLWADLAGQPEVEADLRATVGRTYYNLAALGRAVEHLEVAARLRREGLPPDPPALGQVLVYLAQARVEEPLDRPADRPESPDGRRDRLARAEAHAREAVAVLRQSDRPPAEVLADALLLRAGLLFARIDSAGLTNPDWEPFRAAVREAVEAAGRLPPGPGQGTRLAWAIELKADDTQFVRRDYAGAIRELETAFAHRAADRGNDHLRSVQLRLRIAACHQAAGNHAAAEGEIRRALAGYARVFGGRPNPYTAYAARMLVVSLARQGKEADLAALLPQYPPGMRDAGFRGGWAVGANCAWGWECLQRGDYADAERHYRDALAAAQALGPAAADGMEVDARFWMVTALALQDKWPEVRKEVASWLPAAEAHAAGRPLPAGAATLVDFNPDPDYFYGIVLILAGVTDRPYAEAARRIARRRLAAPGVTPADQVLFVALDGYASYALKDDRAVVETFAPILAADPEFDLHTRRTLDKVLADSYLRLGNTAAAVEVRRKSVAAADTKLTAAHPEAAARRVLLADALVRDGKPAEATTPLEEAYQALTAHPQGATHLARQRADVAARLAAVRAMLPAAEAPPRSKP